MHAQASLEKTSFQSKHEYERACFDLSSNFDTEVRMHFVRSLAGMIAGYRDYLFYLNREMPVFNKVDFLRDRVLINRVNRISRMSKINIVPNTTADDKVDINAERIFLRTLFDGMSFSKFLDDAALPVNRVFHAACYDAMHHMSPMSSTFSPEMRQDLHKDAAPPESEHFLQEEQLNQFASIERKRTERIFNVSLTCLDEENPLYSKAHGTAVNNWDKVRSSLEEKELIAATPGVMNELCIRSQILEKYLFAVLILFA